MEVAPEAAPGVVKVWTLTPSLTVTLPAGSVAARGATGRLVIGLPVASAADRDVIRPGSSVSVAGEARSIDPEEATSPRIFQELPLPDVVTVPVFVIVAPAGMVRVAEPSPQLT